MADQGAEGLLSPFLRSQRLKVVRPYIKGMVLDVGCGTGALASIVPSDCYIGVDLDEQSLAIARQRYPRYSFQSAMPAAEPVFDTVVSLAVIEHVLDPERFLRELAMRLSCGSDHFLVFTTPHPAVDWIHTAGAKVGLFSRHANEEHEDLLDRTRIEALANQCNLKLIIYRRFLFGANQLAVFQKNGDTAWKYQKVLPKMAL